MSGSKVQTWDQRNGWHSCKQPGNPKRFEDTCCLDPPLSSRTPAVSQFNMQMHGSSTFWIPCGAIASMRAFVNADTRLFFSALQRRSLMDPSYLEPGYKALCSASYTDAAIATLAEIRALPANEQPAVVVMSVARIAATKNDAEAAQMLYDLASQLAGHVDIIIAHGFGDDFDAKGGHAHANWRGEEVVVVPESNTLGTRLTSVTVQFKASEESAATTPFTMGTFAVTQIDLDCSVAEDPAVQTMLLDYQRTIQDENVASIFGTLGETFHGEGLMNAAACARRSSGGTSVSKLLAETSADAVVVCGCKVAECGAGKLVTDAVQWYTGADIAIVNGGAIHASFLEGSVSRGDVASALPYHDHVAMLELTGAQVLAMLQHSLTGMNAADVEAHPDGNFLQVSSTVQLRWRYNKDGQARVSDVKVADTLGEPLGGDVREASGGGSGRCSRKTAAAARGDMLPILDDGLFAPLDLHGTYCVATSTFLANGGDGYTVLTDAAHYSPGHSFLQAVGSYIGTFSSSSSAHALNPQGIVMVPASAPATQLGPRAGRFKQIPQKVQLDLGLLCIYSDSGGVEREECDHMLHTIDMPV